MSPNKDNASRDSPIKNENLTMLTISKPKPIDEYFAKFVSKTLAIIGGDPDYESLNEMIQEFYTNAAILPKYLTGGKHSWIGLIMKDTQ